MVHFVFFCGLRDWFIVHPLRLHVGEGNPGYDEPRSHEEGPGNRFAEDEEGQQDCANGNEIDELPGPHAAP